MEKSKINASDVSVRAARLSRRQLLHIRDCASSLIKGSFSLGSDGTEEQISNAEFAKEYREISDSLFSPCKQIEYGSPFDTDFINIASRSEANIARALLCRYISEFSKSTSKPLSTEDFLRREASAPDMKIAYVKNAYSEVAFRAFSSVLTGCSVTYPGSFSAVCEEVYNNRAGFCILPYETSDEGALSGFRQLIIKYELVQVMSCSVSLESAGGTRITRFALLSKGFCPFILPNSAPKFLKVILDNPSNALLSDIYDASELNGLKHVKTESIPVAWDSERYSCAITFSLGLLDPVPFLLYLALEVPEAAADSLYAVL